MFFAIVTIFVSLAILAWAAGRFVMGSAAIARNLQVPPLLIGLTIVALGTSLPEIIVSVVAALQGNTGLAVGNAIGSNTANIGLVLGVTAIIAPLTLSSFTLRREFPVLILVTLFSGSLLLDQRLSRLDGCLLLIGMVGLLIWLIRQGQQHEADVLTQEYEAEIPKQMRNVVALTWLGIGVVVMSVSSRIVVVNAVFIAHHLGVSDFIIGLTIVAVGTSLPELVTSLVSALKNEHDLAIGNIIGSNMFNLLAVLGLPSVIHPDVIDAHVLSRDYLFMLIFTLVLYALLFRFGPKKQIGRMLGTLLLAGYLGYIATLIYTR